MMVLARMIEKTVCFSSMPITVQAGLRVRKLAPVILVRNAGQKTQPVDSDFYKQLEVVKQDSLFATNEKAALRDKGSAVMEAQAELQEA